ncbi:MAG: YkgJ family cysteine cluster protein [Candidatus Bathyarchaeia archaeon]|jgi:Fe-S-cluster containining protein
MEFNHPNISFTCNGCGLCCGDTEHKTRHILLLEAEADAISAETCLPIEDFAVETSGNAPYVYEMKKPSDGKCFFLKNNRCTVYEHRPLICRFYPFELHFDADKDTHIFNYTLECPTINKGTALSRKDFEKLFLLAKQRLL